MALEERCGLGETIGPVFLAEMTINLLDLT